MGHYKVSIKFVEDVDSLSKAVWIQIPATSLMKFWDLGQILKFSVPQFSNL